ncbi:secondary thiamine-phosphate synthase enzyme YjbQ [Shewanella sp. A14]
MWLQRELILRPQRRGFHLITDEVITRVPELSTINVGLLHVFILHTSASLTINENADPTVRGDMERHFNVLAPDGAAYFKHNYEGDDDMPAHIKSTLIGVSQTIPITNGRLNLGVWQGLYLCEHRDDASARTIIVTLQGE